MIFPRNVYVGHGVLNFIPGVCKDLGLNGKALIVSGDKTRAVAGNRVKDILVDDGMDVQFAMTGEATTENLDQLMQVTKEYGPDFVLGVGGGSKIDLAKMVAKEASLSFISVPTSAAHDGVASGTASIKGQNGSQSMDARVPAAVVADTEVIVKGPYRLLAAGCADVISNSTALKDWEFARRLKNIEFSRSAYALSSYTAETIIENADLIRPNMEESVWLAIRPIIISGVAMSVAGSSRPTSGSEHMFSHALDIICPNQALHGEQCGVGCIMMMYLHGGDWRRIKHALDYIGAPTTSRELGIRSEHIIEALTQAHRIRQDRFTILGDEGLSREAAEKVASITKVI